MKIYANILALSVLYPQSWGTTAFSVQAPKTFALNKQGLTSKSALSLSALSSFPGDETGGPLERTSPNVSSDTKSPFSGGGLQASKTAKSIWDTSAPITVQGGTLRTFSFPTPSVESIQVSLKTEGRPLNANVELWQGPDNTPQKMQVFIEDGSFRPFNAVVSTPGGTNAIAIRNTGHMEFPLDAVVEAEMEDQVGSTGLSHVIDRLADQGIPQVIQGGALRTWPFAPNVESVQVLLKTDGRPLNARIELLQGPNNNKQVVELYTEDGMNRPFFAEIETPGVGNVVRIVNTATMEYPLTARVEPHAVVEESGKSLSEGVYTGGTSGSSSFSLN